MKPAVLCTFVLALAATVAWTQESDSSFREFYDQQGRRVEARVVAANAKQVTIERRDGKRFTFGLSILSKPDQEYVREWSTLQASARSSAEIRMKNSSLGSREDWSCFRGPGLMGVSNSEDLPLSWDQQTNVVWKTKLPGAGTSSPITFGNQVYVTCYSGYLVPGEPDGSIDDLQRHLVAIDRQTGEIIWEKVIPARQPEEERIRDHGYAANTPAADENHVYAFFGKSGVFAFTHQGEQVWQADVGEGTHGWGSGSSPLLFNDLVIVNASVESQSLVALDRRTGEERWRVPEINEAWNTPVVLESPGQGRELVIARHGDVLAFDPMSGRPLWSCATDITWYMVPSAVAADGVVYFLGGRSGTAALAVRSGGQGDVTDTHRLWTSRNGSNVTSPIYHEGHLYWMSDSQGIAYCADAETGELVYQQRIARAGKVYASPILADDRIYYLSRGGTTWVIPAKPTFELLATNELDDGSRFDASPAVDGQRLLLRSNRFLYCIGGE
jgi:outer membrane protein assembly factor BamB